MDIWYRAAEGRLALGGTGTVRGGADRERGGGPHPESEEGAALCEGLRGKESSTAAPAGAGLGAGARAGRNHYLPCRGWGEHHGPYSSAHSPSSGFVLPLGRLPRPAASLKSQGLSLPPSPRRPSTPAHASRGAVRLSGHVAAGGVTCSALRWCLERPPQESFAARWWVEGC